MERSIAAMRGPRHRLRLGSGRPGDRRASSRGRPAHLVVVDNDPDRVGGRRATRRARRRHRRRRARAGRHRPGRAPSSPRSTPTPTTSSSRSAPGRCGPTCSSSPGPASTSSEEKLRRAGADRVVNPQSIGGARMAAFVLQPHVAEFLDVVMHDGDLEFRLEEVAVPAGVAARRARRSATPSSATAPARSCSPCATSDGTFTTNPPPDTVIERRPGAHRHRHRGPAGGAGSPAARAPAVPAARPRLTPRSAHRVDGGRRPPPIYAPADARQAPRRPAGGGRARRRARCGCARGATTASAATGPTRRWRPRRPRRAPRPPCVHPRAGGRPADRPPPSRASTSPSRRRAPRSTAWPRPNRPVPSPGPPWRRCPRWSTTSAVAPGWPRCSPPTTPVASTPLVLVGRQDQMAVLAAHCGGRRDVALPRRRRRAALDRASAARRRGARSSRPTRRPTPARIGLLTFAIRGHELVRAHGRVHARPRRRRLLGLGPPARAVDPLLRRPAGHAVRAVPAAALDQRGRHDRGRGRRPGRCPPGPVDRHLPWRHGPGRRGARHLGAGTAGARRTLAGALTEGAVGQGWDATVGRRPPAACRAAGLLQALRQFWTERDPMRRAPCSCRCARCSRSPRAPARPRTRQRRRDDRRRRPRPRRRSVDPGDCITVDLAASPEKITLLTDLARTFNEQEQPGRRALRVRPGAAQGVGRRGHAAHRRAGPTRRPTAPSR